MAGIRAYIDISCSFLANKIEWDRVEYFLLHNSTIYDIVLKIIKIKNILETVGYIINDRLFIIIFFAYNLNEVIFNLFINIDN